MPDAWDYPEELARYVRFLRNVLDAHQITDAEVIRLMELENATEHLRTLDGSFQVEPLGSRRKVVVSELLVTSSKLVALVLNEHAIVLPKRLREKLTRSAGLGP